MLVSFSRGEDESIQNRSFFGLRSFLPHPSSSSLSNFSPPFKLFTSILSLYFQQDKPNQPTYPVNGNKPLKSDWKKKKKKKSARGSAVSHCQQPETCFWQARLDDMSQCGWKDKVWGLSDFSSPALGRKPSASVSRPNLLNLRNTKSCLLVTAWISLEQLPLKI